MTIEISDTPAVITVCLYDESGKLFQTRPFYYRDLEQAQINAQHYIEGVQAMMKSRLDIKGRRGKRH